MIIIKVGGSKNISWDNIALDIIKLRKKESVVLVHGANNIRDEIAKKVGHPTKNVVSPSGILSVYTDKKAIDIFLMAYAGLVNKKIVATLQKHGIDAVGLSGVDGRIWQGKQKSNLLIKDGDKIKLIRNNLTGRVEKVNTRLIKLLIKNNYLPVLCPPAISYDGVIINTDNDFAIAVMAKELDVKKLIVLFEAPGLLKDHTNERSIIKRIRKENIDDYIKIVNGRMKKKVMGAKKAIEGGVKEIFWGDIRVRKPIINALEGNGTVIS